MTEEDLIQKADDVFLKHFHDFDLYKYMNPKNYVAERDRFFEAWNRGEEYQPVFEYVSIPRKLSTIREELMNLKFGWSALEQCFDQTRKEYLALIDTVENIGKEEVTACSAQIYGFPTEQLVATATQILKEKRRESREREEMGIKGLVERFRERLREDQIEGWDVVEDANAVVLAGVDYSHKKIRLQSGIILSKTMVNRILHHEIEGHVYRSMNGERQPYKVFALGLAGYLPTEEGLALMLEEKLGLATSDVRRRYAGRVIAASKAPQQSFFDIFSHLIEYFDPEEAYTLTARSKRGIRNTAVPGGFIQDHVYLQGKKEVERLSANEYRWLYTGKVAVHHLPLIQELIEEKKILAPAFLPGLLHG